MKKLYNDTPFVNKKKDVSNAELQTQLAEKVNQSYVDTKVAAVASGSPKGTYATLTALQTAFPTGTTGVYLVIADGKWYYWSGSAWTAGGTYQSTGLPDGLYGGIKNIYDNASPNNVNGRTLVAATGATSGYVGRFVSTPITVEPNTDYIIAKVSPMNIYNISGFDRNNASQFGSTGFTGAVSFTSYPLVDSALLAYKFTTGATTVAIRFDSIGDYENNEFLVCKLVDFDGFYHKYNFRYFNELNINKKEIKTSEITNDAGFITSDMIDSSKLQGLRGYFLGDSLTQQGKILNAVVEKTGIIATNYGIGGSRLSDIDGLQTTAMVHRVSSMSAVEPDFVFVMGGTNDCYASTVGVVGDTVITTVAGAVSNIISQLQTKYPNAQIIFSCMPRRFDARWEEYANIVLDTCAYYSIPCVDLYHQGGITPFNYIPYMNTDDKVHYNDLGGQRLAPLWIDMLKKVIY